MIMPSGQLDSRIDWESEKAFDRPSGPEKRLFGGVINPVTRAASNVEWTDRARVADLRGLFAIDWTVSFLTLKMPAA